MITIHKYPLTDQDEQILELPKDATALCVQIQHGTPCLWAEVDPNNEIEQRAVYIHGTGHPISVPVTERTYVDTFQLSGGELIFHVFIEN